MDKRSIKNITDHAEVSEKEIEKYLVQQAKKLGLLCLKYSNPNMAGYPDRLLVLPGGCVAWIELKSRGRKPTKLQEIRIAELEAMGHTVAVIDNKAGVDGFLFRLKK